MAMNLPQVHNRLRCSFQFFLLLVIAMNLPQVHKEAGFVAVFSCCFPVNRDGCPRNPPPFARSLSFSVAPVTCDGYPRGLPRPTGSLRCLYLQCFTQVILISMPQWTMLTIIRMKKKTTKEKGNRKRKKNNKNKTEMSALLPLLLLLLLLLLLQQLHMSTCSLTAAAVAVKAAATFSAAAAVATATIDDVGLNVLIIYYVGLTY